MDGAAEVLVIILSIVLLVFLVLSIALIILLIRISHQIKTIASSAERTVQSVEKAAVNMNKFSSPMFLMKLVKKAVKSRKTSNKKEK